MTDNIHMTELTTEIVTAYVSNNPVSREQLPSIIQLVHEGLQSLSSDAKPAEEKAEPATSIKKSLREDHIVCLDCGKSFKSIKRHINARHGQTPAEYREKWGLKSDYPMVAPAYAEARSKIAMNLGLGRKSKK